jgi:hypothetical protein
MGGALECNPRAWRAAAVGGQILRYDTCAKIHALRSVTHPQLSAFCLLTILKGDAVEFTEFRPVKVPDRDGWESFVELRGI